MEDPRWQRGAPLSRVGSKSPLIPHTVAPSHPSVSSQPHQLPLRLLLQPLIRYSYDHAYRTLDFLPSLSNEISQILPQVGIFRLLRSDYSEIRGRSRRALSLKALQAIRIVQFELYQPDFVGITAGIRSSAQRPEDEYHYNPCRQKRYFAAREKWMAPSYLSPQTRQLGWLYPRWHSKEIKRN